MYFLLKMFIFLLLITITYIYIYIGWDHLGASGRKPLSLPPKGIQTEYYIL